MYMDKEMLRKIIKEQIPVTIQTDAGGVFTNALILQECTNEGGDDVIMMQTEEGKEYILHDPNIKDIQPMKPVGGEIFSSRAYVRRLIQGKVPSIVITTNGLQYHNAVILAAGSDAFLIQTEDGCEQVMYRHAVSTIRSTHPMFRSADCAKREHEG